MAVRQARQTVGAASLGCGALLFVAMAACGGGGDLVITATPAKGLALQVNEAGVATTVGQPLKAINPVSAVGGAGTYSYSMAGLPGGLTFDPASGALSGTPTAAFPATSISVSVTDQYSTATASAVFTLTVNERPQTVLNSLAANRQFTQNGTVNPYAPVTGALGTPQYVYSVSPALPTGLSLNSSSGAISGIPTIVLPFPTTFTITITDAAGAVTSATITLLVNPQLTLALSTSVVDATAGLAITPVSATAGGGTAPLSFAVTGLPSGSGLSSDALGRVSGTPVATTTNSIVVVVVTDGANAKSSAQFVLTVRGAVTATPAVSSKACTQLTACVFTPIVGAGGAGPLSYSILPTALPAGVVFSPSTGAISGTPTVIAATTTYAVTVHDNNGAQALSNFSLSVNPPVVATSNFPIRICTQGGPCDVLPVSGSGGTAPLTFTVSPALPSGLSLVAATGQISGPATSPLAETAFTVTVADANGSSASRMLSLTVNAPLVSTLGGATYACTAGVACAFTAVIATGGTAPIAYALSGGSLPTGLSFNTVNGAINGSATQSLDSTTFRITATDAAQATSFKEFIFSVNGPVGTTLVTPSVETTINVSFSTAFPSGVRPVAGSGGTGQLTYLISPALQNGLTFNAGTGTITGTPLATANGVFKVTVSDQAGASSSKDFTLTVNAALKLVLSNVQCAPLITCTVSPVSVNGGTAPYRFSISPALPSGLTFNQSTGAIGGTSSTTFATSTYTVTTTDAVGSTVSGSFTVTSNTSLTTVLNTANVASTIGVPFATAFPSGLVPVSGSGGTGALTYAISATLPTNLSFTPATGQITGTPTVSGIFVLTVKVTDAALVSSSKDFTLTVNQALVWQSPPNSGAVVVCEQNLSCASWTGQSLGGTLPLTFSVSPALPAGLSLSATTNTVAQLSGTPTALSSNSLYTVTTRDRVGATATTTVNLSVVPALTTTLAIAEVGCSFLNGCTPGPSFKPVTAAGGVGTIAYAISPTLPAGFLFDASSGLVTSPASFSALPPTPFTVTATDQIGVVSSKAFALSVLQLNRVVADQVCQIFVPCAYTPFTVSGGKAPIAWQTSNLPAGLTLNTSTGVISGTGTQLADGFFLEMIATDALGIKFLEYFTISVVYPPLVLKLVIAEAGCGESNGCSNGLPFTPVTATGGGPPYYFTVSPALPSGMSIDNATGAISGAPTAAVTPTTFTIHVQDNSTAGGKFQAFTLSALRSTVSITAKNCTIGTSCTFIPVLASGGKPTLTYDLSGGRLPAGMTFQNSSGTIIGTPASTLPTTTFTITITDALGRITSKTFTLTTS